MELKDLEGQRIAIVIIDVTDDEEGDIATATGVGFIKDGKLFIGFGENVIPFVAAPKWMHLINPVTNEKVRQILDGADFCLSLTARKFRNGESAEDFSPLGLELPIEEE